MPRRPVRWLFFLFAPLMLACQDPVATPVDVAFNKGKGGGKGGGGGGGDSPAGLAGEVIGAFESSYAYSWAFDVNADGWVVGYSLKNGVGRPFLWRDGEEVLIDVADLSGFLPGEDLRARAISDDGVIVGSHSAGPTAVRWAVDAAGGASGAYIDDQPGWADHIARVGGEEWITGVRRRWEGTLAINEPVRWRNGVLETLSFPGGLWSASVLATNREGISVGSVLVIEGTNPNGTPLASLTAVVWHPDGSYEPLPALPGLTPVRASDINDSGQIVGSAEAEDGSSAALLWEPLPAGGWALPMVLVQPGGATGINNQGIVVGGTHSGGRKGTTRGFVWSPHTGFLVLDPAAGFDSAATAALNDAEDGAFLVIGHSWNVDNRPDRVATIWRVGGVGF